MMRLYPRSSRLRARPLLGAIAAGLLLALPAAAGQDVPAKKSRLSHFSQAVAFRYWLANPDQAPAQLKSPLARLAKAAAEARSKKAGKTVTAAAAAGLFNFDFFGLPQNEETVAACRSNPNIVIGGTNDYRGLIDFYFDFTGWHLSTNGGTSLANEGLLPPVTIGGVLIPSGGDPVVVADSSCTLYAASLNYDPFDPFFGKNGIGVYRSDAGKLTSADCDTFFDPSDFDCWPVSKAVAVAPPHHFYDKEWIDVGESGAAGKVVWAVFGDFVVSAAAPLGFTSASVKAVRCGADLASCTAPILISGSDEDIQFADVTIAPDGRVYVTWAEIEGELPGDPDSGDPGQPQTFTYKLRVAPAGSTVFGPTRVIAVDDTAIPFDGFLHANDFRVASYPKSTVVATPGGQRVYVVWDTCSPRVFDTICEEPVIRMVYSDDDGATWSAQKTISKGGDNYFPTIATDTAKKKVVVSWYTNRYDPVFHNREDVELVTIDGATGVAGAVKRLTGVSNETEADPALGGVFIGDYFEVFAHNGTAWVHYNANTRSEFFLFDGVPVPQQDNFMIKTKT